MVESVDIRKYWATVKPGLEQIIAKTGAPFMPEDIFVLCVAERASLYLDPDTGAFAVLQARQDPYSKEPVLFLYAVWTPNYLSAENYWPEIERLARQMDAAYVEMVSSRKGFERRSEWEFEYSCYRRRL